MENSKTNEGVRKLPRKKSENRIKAMELFLASDGKAKNTEIAETLREDAAKIRKWKCTDKWLDALKNRPKKSGGQKGNKNAVGHGAPKRNRNAEKHGAYSTIYFDELSPEQKKLIESVTLDPAPNMLRELQTLVAKENDLKKRIALLNADTSDALYIDKVVDMLVPKKKDKTGDEVLTSVDDGENGQIDIVDTNIMQKQGSSANDKLKTAMQTVVKSSAFDRSMKLEAELNKVHGRIIKLLDSIKSYELEQRRIALDEKRYTLLKQRTSGVYDVDTDTNEIIDDYNASDDEV